MDDVALEAVRAGYGARPTARAQAEMGLGERGLGRWGDAERDVSEALQSPRDPWIAKNSAALRGSLAVIRPHVGSLQVVGSPAGAHVKVDDRDVGVLPLDKAVRVTAGQIVVSVSAPGHIEVSRKVDIVAEHLAREVFTLHADVPAAPRDETPTATKPPSTLPRMADATAAEEPAHPAGVGA